jgi:tetratricopeptide (TPR) repeat protein
VSISVYRVTLIDDTKSLEAAVAAAPNDPQAILELGTRYNDEQRFELANTLLEPAVARFRTHGLMRLQYAHALRSIGQLEKALIQYRKSARQLPDDPEPWRGMSMVYEAMNRRVESCSTLVHALYRAPNDISMLRMIGEQLRRAGLPEEGVRFFRRQVQIDPKNSAAHQQLGVFLYLGDQYGPPW